MAGPPTSELGVVGLSKGKAETHLCSLKELAQEESRMYELGFWRVDSISLDMASSRPSITELAKLCTDYANSSAACVGNTGSGAEYYELPAKSMFSTVFERCTPSGELRGVVRLLQRQVFLAAETFARRGTELAPGCLLRTRLDRLNAKVHLYQMTQNEGGDPVVAKPNSHDTGGIGDFVTVYVPLDYRGGFFSIWPPTHIDEESVATPIRVPSGVALAIDQSVVHCPSFLTNKSGHVGIRVCYPYHPKTVIPPNFPSALPVRFGRDQATDPSVVIASMKRARSTRRRCRVASFRKDMVRGGDIVQSNSNGSRFAHLPGYHVGSEQYLRSKCSIRKLEADCPEAVSFARQAAAARKRLQRKHKEVTDGSPAPLGTISPP